MAYFRRPKDHEHPYAQISNALLEDPQLSFKAKGLLSYLLSRCDEWEVFQSQLKSVSTDGETAVRSGLQELIEAGYITRQKRRSEDGTFEGMEYIIRESPLDADTSTTRFSDTGLSDTGSSDTGEARPTNTDIHQNGRNQNGVSAHARGDGTAEGDASPPSPRDSQEGDGAAPVDGSDGGEDDPVEVYRQYYPRTPNDYQRQKLRHEVEDLDRWHDVLDYWKSNSYSAKSIGKMLQRYHEMEEAPDPDAADTYSDEWV